MERRVEGAFADFLKKRREEFNARFASARRVSRLLSPEDFLVHLSETLATTINRAAQIDRGGAEKLCDSLYDLSLRLFAKGCLGPETRYPMIGAAFKNLFPVMPELLLRSPRRAAACISNALYNLSMEKGADEQRWLDTMKALAPGISDPDLFFEAGKAAAWRCGMAHYRDGAIAACDSLSDKILKIVFHIPGDASAEQMKAVRAKLKNNRWFDPGLQSDKAGKSLAVIHEVGGFAGLGGAFVTPPDATVADGQLYLFDDSSHWHLCADAFGSTLHRRGKGAPGPLVSDCRPFSVRKDGLVEKDGVAEAFAELENFKSAAATPDTLAVCVPRSHRAFVLAQKEGLNLGAQS